MKPIWKMIFIIAVATLFVPRSSFSAETSNVKNEESKLSTGGKEKSEDVGGEEQPSGTGVGKAVLEASKKDGLRLSEQALKNIEVVTSPVSVTGPLKLPLSALVFSQADVGIYRLRSGWFKFIEIKIIAKAKTDATVQSAELKSGDLVVVQGADLLKLAELNVWSGGEGGE